MGCPRQQPCHSLRYGYVAHCLCECKPFKLGVSLAGMYHKAPSARSRPDLLTIGPSGKQGKGAQASKSTPRGPPDSWTCEFLLGVILLCKHLYPCGQLPCIYVRMSPSALGGVRVAISFGFCTKVLSTPFHRLSPALYTNVWTACDSNEPQSGSSVAAAPVCCS